MLVGLKMASLVVEGVSRGASLKVEGPLRWQA